MHFDGDGRLYNKSPLLNAWIDYKSGYPDSKVSYPEFCHRDSFELENGIESFQSLKDQTYMYILDHRGHLYLHIKDRGKINHTSLSNGHAVLAAGNLKLEGGKIIAVDTFSGHYKPTDAQLATFLKFLQMRNLDVNHIKVTYVGDYDVQPWKIYDINIGNVSKWLEKYTYNYIDIF